MSHSSRAMKVKKADFKTTECLLSPDRENCYGEVKKLLFRSHPQSSISIHLCVGHLWDLGMLLKGPL